MDYSVDIVCNWSWDGSWESEPFVREVLEETYKVYEPIFGVSPNIEVKALSQTESLAERNGRSELLPDWVSAMCRENQITLLKAEHFKRSEGNIMLLKHELAHVFTNHALKSCPLIFYEGIAVILSGQIGAKEVEFLTITANEMPKWLEIDYETPYFYEKAGLITIHCIQQLGISTFMSYLIQQEWLMLEKIICGGVVVEC